MTGFVVHTSMIWFEGVSALNGVRFAPACDGDVLWIRSTRGWTDASAAGIWWIRERLEWRRWFRRRRASTVMCMWRKARSSAGEAWRSSTSTTVSSDPLPHRNTVKASITTEDSVWTLVALCISQVMCISIVLYTTQIISKQLHRYKQDG